MKASVIYWGLAALDIVVALTWLLTWLHSGRALHLIPALVWIAVAAVNAWVARTYRQTERIERETEEVWRRVGRDLR